MEIEGSELRGTNIPTFLTRTSTEPSMILSIGKMAFEPSKSATMAVTHRTRESPKQQPVTIDGSAVPVVSHVPILGCVFDEKLQFVQHVEKIASKAVAVFRRIRSVLTPEDAEKVYKAYVRPHAEYAPLAWAAVAEMHLSGLQRLQDSCTRSFGKPAQTLSLRRRVARIGFLHRLLKANVRPLLMELKHAKRASISIRTRSSANNSGQLELEATRKNCGRRSWLFQAIRDWNKLPDVIAAVEDVRSLQRECVRFWQQDEERQN